MDKKPKHKTKKDSDVENEDLDESNKDSDEQKNNADGSDDSSDKIAVECGCSESEPLDDKESNRKSNKFLLWAIIIIIILFVLTIVLGKLLYKPGKANQYEYNGYVFTKNGDMWTTEVLRENTLFTVPLHYGARDAEKVPYSGTLNDSFYSSQIFITFDPEKEGELKYVALSAAELSLSLVQAIGYMPVAACTRNTTEACNTRDIIDCNTPDASVIYIKEEGDAKITFNNRCIIVQGTGTGLVKATDALVLQWYGIIKQKDTLQIID